MLCNGNLNRSPAAAKILQRHRPALDVQSAGVAADDRRLIARKMRTALESFGYDSGGRSRRITRVMVDWAELVMVMDERNAEKLLRLWPDETVQLKIRYVGDLIGVKKIPDPHFAVGIDSHCAVVRQLEEAFATSAFDRWLED